MTTKMSPNNATDALNSLRPREEDLTGQWYIGRREQVLQRVMASPDEPLSELGPVGRPRLRWALVAAAAAIVVALGLFAQTLLPSGMLGAPTAAQAMDRLAAVVPAAKLPAGSYVQESLRVRMSSDDARTGTQWIAVEDAWVWSEVTDGKATSYQIRGPEELYVDPATLTGDPADVRNRLRDAVTNRQPATVSVDAAVLLASYNLLGDPRTDPETRALLLRTLGVLDGVEVTNGTDPVGRAATIVRLPVPALTDHFPADSTAEIFFDPGNGQANGFQIRDSSDVVVQERLVTAREVVGELPQPVVSVLGTKREPKSVER